MSCANLMLRVERRRRVCVFVCLSPFQWRPCASDYVVSVGFLATRHVLEADPDWTVAVQDLDVCFTLWPSHSLGASLLDCLSWVSVSRGNAALEWGCCIRSRLKVTRGFFKSWTRCPWRQSVRISPCSLQQFVLENHCSSNMDWKHYAQFNWMKENITTNCPSLR